jgi:hypothetical protein
VLVPLATFCFSQWVQKKGEKVQQKVDTMIMEKREKLIERGVLDKDDPRYQPDTLLRKIN